MLIDKGSELTVSDFSLEELEKIVVSRASAQASSSYTKSLFNAGVEKIARKFGEESIELIIAALNNDKKNKVNEAADVLFHLLVLLSASDITLEDVITELKSRTVQSGIEEKKNRSQS